MHINANFKSDSFHQKELHLIWCWRYPLLFLKVTLVIKTDWT